MKDKLKILGVCGPTKYFRAATVMVGVYPSGGGTSLVSDPGTPDQQVYSVCMFGLGAPNNHGYVWLKGWSENTGVPEAMVNAGLVELTGNTWPTGYATAQEAKILDQAGAA